MQISETQTDPFSTPMIFLRVGWMDHYRGLASGDAITGGGSFVQEHGYGFEIYNFLEHAGKVYGFVQPPRGTADMSTFPQISIQRLGASAKDEAASNVLAVWVANHPSANQCLVVGWYQNATVYRNYQQPPPGAGRTLENADPEFGYYVTASSNDAILLEKDDRLFSIPTGGQGRMGQSNVWYADNAEIHGEIRRQVLNYIANKKLADLSPDKSQGIPHQTDPLLRQKIEKAAVSITTDHFTSRGYSVDSFEKDNVGWDLEAVYRQIKLRLEVKGLSDSELCVELTPNEYAKMKEYRDSYRICVVTNALTNPTLSVFGYSPDSQRWEDQDGRILSFQEIIAARCRGE